MNLNKVKKTIMLPIKYWFYVIAEAYDEFIWGINFKKLDIRYGDSLSLSFNPMQFKSPHYLKELITSVIPENELSSKMEGKIFTLISEYIETSNSFRDLITRMSIEIPDLDLYFSELWEYFDNETRTLTKLTYVDTSLYPDKIKAPLIIYLIECFKGLEGNSIGQSLL